MNIKSIDLWRFALKFDNDSGYPIVQEIFPLTA